MDVAERRRICRAHLIYQRANPGDTRVIIRLAKIHGAADLRMHFRAAQIFRGGNLPNGRLYQRGTSQKQSRAFRHQDVVAHQRQIRSASHAHAHDRGELRNAHCAHHRVIAENSAEIICIGEDVFLQRQKNTGGINQVNRGYMILDSDILRADDFLRSHGEKSAGFHGCVISDEHERPPADFCEASDGSRGGRAAPFLIHLVSRKNAKLEELRAGIDKLHDALSRREPTFFVLRFDGFCTAALDYLFFFVLDFRKEINNAAVVFFEVGRLRFHSGFQNGRSHSQTSRRD